MSGDGGFSAPWGSPDPDGGAGGPAGPGAGLTDADRDAAVAALDVHRTAGRIDDVGFEERSVRARRAVTRADLDLLFLDLPEPHAVTGTAPPLPPAPAAPMYGTPSAAPVPQPPGQPVGQPYPPYAPGQSLQPRRSFVSPEVARTVMALSPFVAFALFWFTRQWIFFLLIPVARVLVLGDNGRRGRNRRGRP